MHGGRHTELGTSVANVEKDKGSGNFGLSYLHHFLLDKLQYGAAFAYSKQSL